MKNDLWWLEYLEGELDARSDDMKLILKRSMADQIAINEIEGLKAQLRTEKPIQEIDDLSDDYFDQLHDKIMAGIDTGIENQIASRESNFAKLMQVRQSALILAQKRKAWLKAAAAPVLFAMLMFGSFHLTRSPATVGSSDRVLQMAMSEPSAFISMVSHENPNDFFADVANQSEHNLSLREMEQLMGE
jgi:hypothetical protein